MRVSGIRSATLRVESVRERSPERAVEAYSMPERPLPPVLPGRSLQRQTLHSIPVEGLDRQVERSRLLNLMSLERAATRVWFMVAPAGCGKTSLLTQIGKRDRAAGRRVAWLTVSGTNEPPHGFFRFLREAVPCENVGAVGGESNTLPAIEAADHVLEALRRGPPTTLIIDAIEELREATDLALLQRLVDGWPPGHLLFCAGRSLGSLRLGRGLLDGIVKELGAADLALDLAELAELAQRIGIQGDCAVLLQGVASRSGGWAAGARALLMASRTGEMASGVLPAPLVRYLEEEICRGLATDEVEVLMDLATLGVFNIASISELPDRPLTWERLDRLRRLGAPIEPCKDPGINSSGEWFRVQPLVAHLLALQQRRVDRSRSDLLQRYAARWLEESDQMAPAAPVSGPPSNTGEAALASGPSQFNLSPREREILELLSEGLSAKEIAERLSLSVSTVKTHRKKLYSKMSVWRRSQAIARARASGLL
jgi:ATP/maltotriose-dependent transcriptional regulator MalT